MNERLVMRIVQDKGPLTRVEMSKSIGITFPTVNKAVSSLLDSKLLEEFEETRSGPGRPAKRLRLASEHSQVIGVTLSDSDCTIATAGLNGAICEDSISIFETPPTYKELLDCIAVHAKKLMATERMTTLCLGVSIPGIVDYKSQRAVFSANVPMVNGRRMGKDLQIMLDTECIIIRDAHAFSLSERLTHENLDSVKNVAMLDHSEGIGVGLMINNEFLAGDQGFGGELGHIPMVINGDVCHCGKIGCLETVASEWALEEKTTHALGRSVKVDEILQLAKAGDKHANQELENMCEHLAMGVACVINIFNPGLFYIYGKCFREMPSLFDILIERTKKHTLAPSFAACEFAPASGGELDGTIASVINYLTDSLVPDIEHTGITAVN